MSVSTSLVPVSPRPTFIGETPQASAPQGDAHINISEDVAWERVLRAAPGGTLQGNEVAAFRRTQFLHRYVNVPGVPAGVPIDRTDRRGFDAQDIAAMNARAEDAPPPIDIDVDDLAYAIFGVDPDGDAVSTSIVSTGGLDAILGVSAAVIYLLGTVPAGMQIHASYKRLVRLGRESQKIRDLLQSARNTHAAAPSSKTQERLRALIALGHRAKREIATERSRLSLAGCSAALGTFLAGTSALLKFDRPADAVDPTAGNANNNIGVSSDGDGDDGDKTKRSSLTRGSHPQSASAFAKRDDDGDDAHQTLVQKASSTIGAVGVGFIGLYGVGTAVQFGVNCVQHFRQKPPAISENESPWDIGAVDVHRIMAQHRTRLWISDAAAAASYAGIGVGVPMTNWSFMRNLPAGLTLLLSGAAGAMATKFYVREVLRYRQIMPLLQRMRLDTPAKIYLELGFVAQELDLLKTLQRGLPSVFGLRRGKGSYNELFQNFLLPRLQLEQAYWSRKADVLAAAPASEDTAIERGEIECELDQCGTALAEVRTQARFEDSPMARAERLIMFFDRNGLWTDLCHQIVKDGALREQVNEADVLRYSPRTVLERMAGEKPELQGVIADTLAQKAVLFLAGSFLGMRRGRLNELCDMAMDLDDAALKAATVNT